MTMNVRPSRVSIVSGVCTLSSTLTGEDENSISERSRRGRFDGIHQARAPSRISTVTRFRPSGDVTWARSWAAEARAANAQVAVRVRSRAEHRIQVGISIHRLRVSRVPGHGVY